MIITHQGDLDRQLGVKGLRLFRQQFDFFECEVITQANTTDVIQQFRYFGIAG
ncbi:hypothetical protein D3C86_1896750 [compost metagenome]